MKDNKISFIYCVNRQDLFEESTRYVHALDIPKGYEIEIIPIKGAASIFAGYNQGQAASDGKYKVFLHQDVFIVNKNFLTDMIELFENHPNLGLFGMAGAKSIPENGVWWESKQLYGKVYDSISGALKLLSFKEIDREYEKVQAVDGLLMATQYDLRWREDLFDGWHFYDVSQCQEYIRSGYEVGVVRQQSPWCIHDCGKIDLDSSYQKAKDIFIANYRQPITVREAEQPLVSVLIPAYNRPHYLEIALRSVLNQTYKNIEIIISDDSTNDEVNTMLKPYLESNSRITYLKNPEPLGEENFTHCLQHASGEFINYLMDDDYFHPEKIKRMVDVLLTNPTVSLVTSYRQLIDANGTFLNPVYSTQRLADRVTVFNGKALGNACLKNNINLIGEPTTALFRKTDLTDERFGYYRDKKFTVVNDLATWLFLLTKGDAVYLPEALSYFRMHEGQYSNSFEKVSRSIHQWYDLIEVSREDGYLDDDVEYRLAINNFVLNTTKWTSGVIQAKQHILLKKDTLFAALTNAVSRLTLRNVEGNEEE